MAKGAELEAGARNHIATGTKITGDIETNGDFRLDGVLIGSINSKGKVVLGESGSIEGEVFCQNANISGEIKGKVMVKELLSMQATARIHGDVETAKLSIEPGANFTGSCNMGAVIKDINAKSDGQAKEKTA
ncbi:MAG: polymer-forming cytoskeletal protein [Flavobacteriales bacterium]|nr:polymer-forming cytoskeletal protein [Flavobacteriales bacterium]